MRYTDQAPQFRPDRGPSESGFLAIAAVLAAITAVVVLVAGYSA